MMIAKIFSSLKCLLPSLDFWIGYVVRIAAATG